jgi:hypothetical protein
MAELDARDEEAEAAIRILIHSYGLTVEQAIRIFHYLDHLLKEEVPHGPTG